MISDNTLIYSSIFLLVSFIVIFKFIKFNIILSLGIPLIIIILYIILYSSNDDDIMNVLTDYPDF